MPNENQKPTGTGATALVPSAPTGSEFDTDRPTQEGVHWYVESDCPKEAVAVVDIGGKLHAWRWGEKHPQPLDGMTGEWLGEIPE